MRSPLAGILGQYRRGRAVFVVTTLIVTLGVAATSSIFALAERLLLHPLPLREPHRLVSLRVQPDDAAPNRDNSVLFPESYANLLEFEAASSIAAHGWFLSTSFQLGHDDQSVALDGAGVARDFFKVLGVPPALGRFPSAAELDRGEPVAVVSHSFWRQHLGADPHVIGQDLHLNGRSYTLSAVLPPRAGIPANAEIFVPLEISEAQKAQRTLRYLFHLGRLRDGVSLEQAQADIDLVAASLLERFPVEQRRWRSVVAPFVPLFVDGQDRTVLILLGLFAAAWATPRLGALNPNPFLDHLYVDLALRPSVGLATAGLVLLLALAAGLLPAWQNLSVESGHVLRESTRGGSASRRVLRTQRWLIRGQLALTSAFLVVGALLGLSYHRLRHVDQGFALHDRVAVSFSVPANRYAADATFHQLSRALQDRLDQEGALTRATVTTNLPLGDLVWSSNFAVTARDHAAPEFSLQLYSRITESFLETSGLRLLHGRGFTRDDRAETMPVALVNESFARRYWPGEEAVGKTILRRRGSVVSPPILVVGIVSDVVVNGPRNGVRPVVYLPITQSTPANTLTVLAESPRPAAEAIASVKAAVAAVDPTLAVAYASPLSERFENTLSVERFQARLLGAMGTVCLLITALGVYGMVERHVTAREVESVIRSALGASPGEIVWLHTREQALLVLPAIIPGLALAAFVARQFDLQLFGIAPLHPLPYFAAATLVLGIVAVSMVWPLARALRLPLAQVLRG